MARLGQQQHLQHPLLPRLNAVVTRRLSSRLPVASSLLSLGPLAWRARSLRQLRAPAGQPEGLRSSLPPLSLCVLLSPFFAFFFV
eukprot:2873964-Pyramimonas_sp.AAC.1